MADGNLSVLNWDPDGLHELCLELLELTAGEPLPDPQKRDVFTHTMLYRGLFAGECSAANNCRCVALPHMPATGLEAAHSAWRPAMHLLTTVSNGVCSVEDQHTCCESLH
jgi:hypothetical protein